MYSALLLRAYDFLQEKATDVIEITEIHRAMSTHFFHRIKIRFLGRANGIEFVGVRLIAAETRFSDPGP